jgi:hypothetical protein
MTHIKNYAGQARERGRAKIVAVCAWLYRNGFSDHHIIAAVAGDELRYASKLVKKGYLSKIKNPDQSSTRTVFVLTELGLTIALDKLAGLIEYIGLDISYPYLQNKRLPWTLMAHSLLVQQCLIKLRCHLDIDSGGWLSERELIQFKAPYADAMVVRGDSNMWLEVERTTKNRESRCLQFWGRLQALKQGRFHKMLWVAAGHGTKLAIERELGKDVCVMAYRDDSHRIVIIPGLGESMDTLKEASIVSTFDDLEDWDKNPH